MFTGLIEEVGKLKHSVQKSGSLILEIYAPSISSELNIGESIATNGVCLTVISSGALAFRVEAVEETLRKTTLSSLRTESRVNLERAMKFEDRFGGHFVQGHVDRISKIRSIENRPDSVWLEIEFAKEDATMVVPHGSITIDGVSFTVAKLLEQSFCVSVIPHTLDHTIIQEYKMGDKVNIEFDVLGKYVLRAVQHSIAGQKITTQFLENLEF